MQTEENNKNQINCPMFPFKTVHIKFGLHTHARTHAHSLNKTKQNKTAEKQLFTAHRVWGKTRAQNEKKRAQSERMRENTVVVYYVINTWSLQSSERERERRHRPHVSGC